MKTQQVTEKDVLTLLGKMQDVKVEVDETLTKHYQDDSDNLIPAEKFSGMDLGDKIYFNDNKNNYAELVCITTEKLVFIVINNKGAEVHKHKHNFQENFHILKGKLWEQVSERLYISGDEINIRPFVLHGFIAQELSIYAAVVKLV